VDTRIAVREAMLARSDITVSRSTRSLLQYPILDARHPFVWWKISFEYGKVA
jgi:hypothetical protein